MPKAARQALEFAEEDLADLEENAEDVASLVGITEDVAALETRHPPPAAPAPGGADVAAAELKSAETRDAETRDDDEDAARAAATPEAKAVARAARDLERNVADTDAEAQAVEAEEDAERATRDIVGDTRDDARWDANEQYSRAPARRGQPRGKSTRAALARVVSSVLGRRAARRLIDRGVIALHETDADLPAHLRAGANEHSAAGIYDPATKVFHLIAARIDAGEERGVLGHETWHKFLHALGLADQAGYRALMRRLRILAGDRANRVWFDRARARLRGQEFDNEADYDNELAAYAIEEYENAPRSLPQTLVKWARDFLANVRAFLLANGFDVGPLHVADLAAISRGFLRQQATVRDNPAVRRTERAESPLTRADAAPVAQYADASTAANPVRPVIASNDATTLFTLLTQTDDAFQQPTPVGETIEDITREIAPEWDVEDVTPRRPQGYTRAWRLTRRNAPADEHAEIYEDAGEGNDNPRVWINVSNLHSGANQGNRIYGVAAGYAHNTGKTFTGDPEGLTRVGFFRRLENMISSALRYGTTDHLAPHDYQLYPQESYTRGSELEGLGLQWEPGNYEHNLAEMLRVAHEAARRFAPELGGLTYDFERNEFRDERTGWHGDRRGIEKAVAGNGREYTSGYRWGSATGARVALLNTLLPESGNQGRPGLLAGVVRQLSRQALDPNLKRVFYSRANGADIEADEEADANIDATATAANRLGDTPLANLLRATGAALRRGRRGLRHVVFTATLIREATEAGMTSVREWARRVNERQRLALRHEEQVVNIVRDISALDSIADLRRHGAAKANAVWEFIRDATMTQNAFKAYAWLPKGTQLDRGMVARYNALPKAAQDIIDRVFTHSHDTRERVFRLSEQAIQETLAETRADIEQALPNRIRDAQDAVRERANNDNWDNDKRNAQLDAAETRVRAAAADQIAELERAARTQEKLFGEARSRIKLYAPLRRVGKFATVAWSKAYETARQENDTETMRQLASQAEHYWVNFFDSDSAAERAAVELSRRPEFAGGRVRHFEREQFLQSRDALPFDAFRRMEDAIRGDENRSATQMDALRLLRELYITSLAETSARKSALPRLGVHGMDANSMRQSFAAQGSADARYIASLSVGQAERAAFQNMREQANDVEHQHERMPLFNLLKAREAAMLNRPSEITSNILKFNSWMRLVLNPAYYFYNLTQPMLMTHPYLARSFGWEKAANGLTAAMSDVWNTRKGAKGVAASIRDFARADLLPKIYRASEMTAAREENRPPMTVIEELASRGKIDITIAQDLGLMARGSGELAARMPRAGAVLDKMERFFSAAMAKSEMVNRMATGLSAYRLMLEQQKAKGVATEAAEAAALEYAEDAIDMTQGDYATFNAPAFMSANGIARIATQFRKFQLIQATYISHMFREAFLRGNLSRAEKRAARLAFGYAGSRRHLPEFRGGLLGFVGDPRGA